MNKIKLILAMLILIVISLPAEASWWNTSWNYSYNNPIPNGYRPYVLSLNISNNTVGFSNSTHLNVTCYQPACKDLRFVQDNTTVLPYVREENTTASDTTYHRFWFNLTSNATSGFQIYTGSVGVPDVSDGNTTFDILFDDFPGNILNTSKWNTPSIGGTGSATVTNNNLDLYAPAGVGNGARVTSKKTIPIGYEAIFKVAESQLSDVNKRGTSGVNNINTVFAWNVQADYTGSQGTSGLIPHVVNTCSYFVDGVQVGSSITCGTETRTWNIKVPSTSATYTSLNNTLIWTSGTIGNNANPVAFKLSGHDANAGVNTHLNVSFIAVRKMIPDEQGWSSWGNVEYQHPTSLVLLRIYSYILG